MAQTKRKRQTKHRGNAAGVIETRGRTSRPLSPDEKRRVEKQTAREARLNKRPTWRSAAQKAVLAGGCMFVFLLIFVHSSGGNKIVTALFPAVLAIVLYIPASFYLETFLWRRRTGQETTATSIFPWKR